MLIKILITISIIAIELFVFWVLNVVTTENWMELGKSNINWNGIIMLAMLLMFIITYGIGAWKIAEWLIN